MNQHVTIKAAVLLELAAERQAIEDQAFADECRETAEKLREEMKSEKREAWPGHYMGYSTYQATVEADLRKYGIQFAYLANTSGRWQALVTHYFTTKRTPSEAAARIAAEARGAVW